MAITPIKKRATKPASSGKKKQMSLMSFFKPQQSSPSKTGSDKENEDSNIHSTPLTSDSDPTPSSYKQLDSSPLKTIKDTPQLKKKDIEADYKKKGANVVVEVVEEKEVPVQKKEIPPTPAVVKETPAKNATPVNSSPLKATQSSSKRSAARSVSYIESDSETEAPTPSSRKKRKIIESDDDDDEFKMDEDHEDDDDDMSDFVVDDNEDVAAEVEEDDDVDEEEVVERKRPQKKKSSSPTKNVPSTTEITESSGLGQKFSASSSYVASANTPVKKKSTTASTTPGSTAKKNFSKGNEERYQWLVNIKDSEKRPIDHPEYDSRTLYVPSSAWSKFTNFEKQYWEIKSKMWDTVVFFKKGKFYELYENDATIANSQFDLKIAGGGRANMKLAGIPEMSFEYWAKEFISHGYKVAKVDQKESLLAKEMRGGASKEDKIIKRELSCVLTGGTLTDMNMINDDMAIYCLSVREENIEGNKKKFGIAFVDTATSELNMIEVVDDAECTKLDTIITQIKPKEIIVEKNNLCSIATKLIKHNSDINGGLIWNNLNPYSEFWDYDTTLENLVKSKYYPAEDLDDLSNYPKTLIEFKDNYKLAFHAFGGLLYYLKGLKLDTSIMTLGNINQYDMVHKTSSLLLDGITLTNLEILNNSFDGTDKGTLFKLLNRAITSFGKRHLKNWILHPLLNSNEINARYDSVDYLRNNGEFRDIVEQGLSELPDLERLIARVHGKTLRFKDFVKVIEGYERVSRLMSILKSYDTREAGVLQKFIENFPSEMEGAIEQWSDAFDRDQALNDIVVPEKGVDSEFDDSQAKMDKLEAQLNEYLKVYKKEYKSHEICFRDSGKEIFLIEMPVKIKNIPKDWQQMGSTSKVKRFWSPEVRKLVRQLLEQRELHKMLCETLRFRMYDRFDAHYKVWISTIKALSNIDCLIALTKTSESIGFPACRPEFVTDSNDGTINFKELRHPCFVGTNDFIPNDVILGGDEANIGLLTGANAAGKSTLMRTTALAVILSQIGCYVPAESAKLSPVDKIMTRLGANDNIMQGKSTFFVELSETKKILENATPKSLVILDELGRGGSSSDGYAIAESVLYHLATHVQSLGFFATHYGTLGLSFKTHPKIKPLRMAIVVDKNSRNITFLYKLEAGAASGSFGMNVASMCGISEDIVVKAEIAAKEYEHTSKLKKLTEEMLQNEGSTNLSLGLQSDFSWLVNNYEDLSKSAMVYDENVKQNALKSIFKMIESL
ncbi:DNA mismatch repair protein Msh6p [[Candida] anglica]|uniref:DNA mismatch repair protein n=1 Tax=[Candida] anglica TaxID=148631 RepID=A0ABP0E8W8_9ASCO